MQILRLMVFSLTFSVIGCDTGDSNGWEAHVFKTTDKEPGQHLYLRRDIINFVTHRAKFDYAQDCQLIQEAIQEKEPHVVWFCAGKVK